MAALEKSILVKIRGLVEGLGEVRAFAAEVQKLQAAPAGAGAISVGRGNAGEVRQLSAEIKNLGEQVKKLEPSRLRKFVEVLGGAGNFLQGLPKIKEAREGLRDAAEAGKQFVAFVGEKASAGAAKLSDGVSGLSSKLPGLASGLGLSSGGLAAVGAAGAAAGVVLGVVLAAVAALAVALVGVGAAAAIAAPVLEKIFGRGVEYNSNLEQTRLGIAAVVASLAELRAADGRQLEGAEKLDAAYSVAGDQLEKLKVDAVNTVATFEQIAPAFQAAIGAGTAAGLTLDQVRATTVQIVQAASALNIPLEQVNQEVRAILEGTINEDARLAKVLGISNEMVKKWKEQGTLAGELNKRLAQFAIAGERAASTLSGLKSNLQEAFNVFSGAATERAFETLKTRMAALLPQLFDFKNARLDQSFKPLSDLIDDVFVRGLNLAGNFIQYVVDGVKSVSRFVGENRALIDLILASLTRVIQSVGRIAGVLVGATSTTGTWQNLLNLTHGVLVLIELVLGAIEAQIRRLLPGLQLLVAGSLLAAQNVLGIRLQNPTDAARQREFTRLNGGNRPLAAPDQEFELPGGAGRTDSGGFTVRGLPRIGGGGGGKKGGADNTAEKVARLKEQLDDALLSTDRARVERAYSLTKDFLERQTAILEGHLADRLMSVEQFYADQERVRTEAVDAEAKKLEELYRLEEQRRDSEKARAAGDKGLTAGERRLQIALAEERFKQAAIPIGERLTVLERERLDIAGKITRERRNELEAFERLLAGFNEQLANETGDTDGSVAAARTRIDAEFKDRLAQIAAQKGADSTEMENARQLVEVLKKKAEYQLLYNQLKEAQAALDFAEEQIRRDVERGVFTERQGRALITEEQLRHKAAVEATVESLRKLAEATGDAGLQLEVARVTEGMRDLGRVVDVEAVNINRSLRDAAEGTLFDIIRNPRNAKQAITDFFNHVLDELARVASAALIEQIFGQGGPLGGVFGGAQGGGVGGILSGIFGGGRPALPGAGGGGQAGGDSVLSRIPGVITNFQGSVGGGFRSTQNVLSGGFNSIGSKVGEIISFLPNLIPTQPSFLRRLAAAAVSAAVAAAAGAVAGPNAEGGGGVAIPESQLPAHGRSLPVPSGAGLRRAQGGPVSGPGTATSDSILAFLSDGEFVIREWAARMLGPDVLAFINRFGRLPAQAFALGGPVSYETPSVASRLSGVGPGLAAADGGVTVNVSLAIHAQDKRSFEGSSQQIKRDVSRAAEEGYRRASGARRA